MSVQLDNRPYKGRVDISVQVCRCLLCDRTKPEELNAFFFLAGYCLVVGSLTDVLLSRAGPQWERRRQVGVHGEPGDCVEGIQLISDASSWTVGDHDRSECRVEI